MLSALTPDKVCFLIVKLREFGVQAEPRTDDGSDAIDDKFVEVFENEASPSVNKETEGLIDAMNTDEQCELIALALLGRGDYDKDEWSDAMSAAGSHPEPTTSAFLLQIPLISDYLEEGLAGFGINCSNLDAPRD